MARQDEVAEHPRVDAANALRLRTYGTLTMIGAAVLVLGAALVDLGSFTSLPAIGSLGNALSAAAGLGLLFLPVGLRASRLGGTGALANVGAASLALGVCLASLADVPAILDPTDLEAGGVLGPPGLVLISVGFLAWFAAIRQTRSLGGWRKYLFLLAGLWFPLTFPTVQLPLFVIPNGSPSFVLLAGVFGVLQLVMGMIVREQAGATGNPSRQAF